MGGARAFVAGSTSWPAWSCSVSNSGSLKDDGEPHQRSIDVVRTCINLRSWWTHRKRENGADLNGFSPYPSFKSSP